MSETREARSAIIDAELKLDAALSAIDEAVDKNKRVQSIVRYDEDRTEFKAFTKRVVSLGMWRVMLVEASSGLQRMRNDGH